MQRQAMRLIGLLLIVVACALTARWYIAWLSRHLTWNPLRYSLPGEFGTYLVAIITAPAIPVAIVVEWIWHGWPEQPGIGFFVWLIGYGMLLFGRSPEPRDKDYFGPEHE